MNYSDRILQTSPSFIRNILAVTQNSDTISFAGGLPNPISFPIKDLQESMNRAIEKNGSELFQYSSTSGYLPLREYIAAKYKKLYNLTIYPNDILITNGSQQALVLIGKVLLNKGDKVIIEEPGYLGAIQAFSLSQPEFLPVTLETDGLNLEQLEQALQQENVKLVYTVPNFQNPTGLTYSKEKRKAIAGLLSHYDTALIEDDPYGELRFQGESLSYIYGGKTENSILLGTFSKMVTPGMRLGFLITKNVELMNHLNTAKQASDLHTNIFTQYVILDYLSHYDYQSHVDKIIALYKEQSTAMLDAMKRYFPSHVSYTKPEGGMFIWATMQNGQSAMEIFEKAMEQNVAFVPGDPFYVNIRGANTMRLNYTNSDVKTIEDGIRRLASVL